MNAKRFNLLCKLSALLLLMTLTLWRYRRDPAAAAHKDFPQYYMGGLIARHQLWDALYPIPHPGSTNNPGDPRNSDMQPQYARLAQQYHVGMPRDGAAPGLEYDENRFIQPPPTALLFIPLTFFSYMTACALWQTLMAICGWGIALVAGRTYLVLRGRNSLVEGIVVLITALVSPAMRRAIIPGNVSPAVGLCVAIATLSLLRRRGSTTAVVILFGGLLKYVTGMLVPLALMMRQIKCVFWLIVAGSAVLILSLAIEGWAPFREFFRLLSTLNKPWYEINFYNQSIFGLVFSITHHPPGGWMLAGIYLCNGALLLLICALIYRRRRSEWSDPAQVLAAASALICWYCIFSPIFWTHYAVYLLPFFGYLIWELQRGPAWKRALAAGAILITCLPAGSNAMRHQPMTTYLLWSAVMMLLVSLRRLILRSSPSPIL